MTDPITIAALKPVIAALEAAGVEYYIGGSLASSVHGIARSTIDVDIVAYLRAEHVGKLVLLLSDEYYVDAAMIKDALRTRSSFNLIHHPTSYKVDIFLPSARPFERSVRERVVRGRLPAGDAREVPLVSPEDIILNKLEWYRQGGEVSERQWNDVLGVMKVQGTSLNRDYLGKWAVELGVSDLLERALREAGHVGG